MIEKMSKSNSTTPNIKEKDEIVELKSKISALTSECNYWKLRHALLEKYQNNSNSSFSEWNSEEDKVWDKL